MEKEERLIKINSIINDNLVDMSKRYRGHFVLESSKDNINRYLKRMINADRDYLLTDSLIHYLISHVSARYIGFRENSFENYMRLLSSNDDSVIIAKIIDDYFLYLNFCKSRNERWAYEGTRLANEGSRIIKSIHGLNQKLLDSLITMSGELKTIHLIPYKDRCDMSLIFRLYASKALVINDYDYFLSKAQYLINNYKDLFNKLELAKISDPGHGIHGSLSHNVPFVDYITKTESTKKLIIE